MSAIVSALAALSGAAVAGWFGLRAARLATASAERLSATRLEHERLLRADDRRQARIERAYLELLGVVNQCSETIERDTKAKEPPDYDVEDDAIAGVWAELDAFGSKAAHKFFSEWRAARLVFRVNISNARRREPGTGSGDPVDVEELIRNRNGVLAAAHQLRERVATELRGES